MSRIIAEHKANLLLQILLHINVYVLSIWSTCYLLFLIICLHNLGPIVVVAYMLAVIIEVLRLNVGYHLNLIRRRPKPKSLSWILLALSLPFVWSLCYLVRFVVRQEEGQEQPKLWLLHVISYVWLLIVVLELFVALYELWVSKPEDSALPKWARIDKKEQKRQREHCAIPMHRFG